MKLKYKNIAIVLLVAANLGLMLTVTLISNTGRELNDLVEVYSDHVKLNRERIKELSDEVDHYYEQYSQLLDEHQALQENYKELQSKLDSH